MAELRLQVNTCFAAKNWPIADDWLSLVSEWGVTEVQFSFDLLDPFHSRATEIGTEIRKAADAKGITVASTFTGTMAYVQNMLLHPDPRYREYALEWYLRAIELTKVLGAKTTGGHFGALSAAEEYDSSRRRERTNALQNAFAQIGAAAEVAGLEYLVWELMPSSRELPHTPEEALDLLDKANRVSPIPVRLCYDLGHACAHDVHPNSQTVYEWLDSLLPVTPMVHLQQTDGQGDHHWAFSDAYNGQGIIVPGEVKKVLAGSPFKTVDLVLEVLHPPEAAPAQIRTDWADSIAYWRG